MKKSLFALTLTALFLSACGSPTAESEPACKEYAANLQKQSDSAATHEEKEALTTQLTTWKQSMAQIKGDQLKAACQALTEAEKNSAAEAAQSDAEDKAEEAKEAAEEKAEEAKEAGNQSK